MQRPALLNAIGNTPLVPISRLSPNPKVEIWAKLEKMNLGGSVKDRIALYMIEAAERSGELTPGKTILEATSGNTGIGLAMVAAIKGYPITLAMSEGVSVERRKILSALGAEILLTPAELGTDGAIERVYGMVNDEPDRYHLTDQYNNDANLLAHYETTAPEIWRQTDGRLTHFVATIGTTGTLMGCARRLHEYDPKIQIIGVEPYLGHKIQGLKNLKEAYVPGIYDGGAIDQKINIEDDEAYEMARRLAREEGLLVGMSSGAAMAIAHRLAGELDAGVIVAMFPDGGERYLSTTLFTAAAPEAEAEPVVLQLRFFNSLTRRTEAFKPLASDGPVTMYSCGPTVHRRPHLGVLRRMLADDLIRRTLEFAGHHVEHVVSITDLDDNTIQEAERLGEDMVELCARHEEEFHEDMRALCVDQATSYARTSELVDDMIGLTQALVDKGVAYEKLRSVYFNIGRSEQYGELSGFDLGKIKIGATVDLERYDKDDPRDFTLLRRSTLGEIRKGLSYKTPWGNVRPSWHVQCSAMARAKLGDRFDIHMSSVDLIFPHNENELAQGRALTGDAPAHTWLHSELVLVGGKKISFAPEAYTTLPDLLERGYSAREVRFLLLSSHYRQPVHLNDERLDAARGALKRLDDCVIALRAVTREGPHFEEVRTWIADMRERFKAALFDDVNISEMLGAVFRLVKQLNYLSTQGKICKDCATEALEALREMDQVLGVLPSEAELTLPPEIEALVGEREGARQDKDFDRSDALREELARRGYLVEDTAYGPRVKPR